MEIITIIGTRPQYIKLKPLYDYFKKNNICNYIIDTNQHYSDNVSKNLIEELDLEIDCNLGINFNDEISFMSNAIPSIFNKLKEICIDREKNIIVVIGDTNSTLISSLVSKKMGLKLAHIEAGIRCGDKNRPEELNRILIDNLSDVHFISRKKDRNNVLNPIYVGDLEYNFLNSIENKYRSISYDGEILLTIHRQENVNTNNLNKIFKFCESLKSPIVFSLHHRTDRFIKNNNIFIPDNIKIIKPLSYMEIIFFMRICRGIISDSGGIIKTSPFFGKKCIIPLEKVEWNDVIDNGYAINQLDLKWFDDYEIKRDMNLYYVDNSCEIITKELLNIKNDFYT